MTFLSPLFFSLTKNIHSNCFQLNVYSRSSTFSVQHHVVKKRMIRRQEVWILVCALPLMSYETLGESLNLSGLYVSNRGKIYSLIYLRMAERSNEIIDVTKLKAHYKCYMMGFSLSSALAFTFSSRLPMTTTHSLNFIDYSSEMSFKSIPLSLSSMFVSWFIDSSTFTWMTVTSTYFSLIQSSLSLN